MDEGTQAERSPGYQLLTIVLLDEEVAKLEALLERKLANESSFAKRHDSEPYKWTIEALASALIVHALSTEARDG